MERVSNGVAAGALHRELAVHRMDDSAFTVALLGPSRALGRSREYIVTGCDQVSPTGTCHPEATAAMAPHQAARIGHRLTRRRRKYRTHHHFHHFRGGDVPLPHSRSSERSRCSPAARGRPRGRSPSWRASGPTRRAASSCSRTIPGDALYVVGHGPGEGRADRRGRPRGHPLGAGRRRASSARWR